MSSNQIPPERITDKGARGRADSERHVTRRTFLKALSAAATGATIAACVPAASQPAPSNPARVQLVYQDWRTDWFPQLAQEALKDFHERHPNIQVFYTPDPENLPEQMPLAMEVGRAPDVLAGCCDFFPSWAQQGYLLDLRPFVEADLDRSLIEDWNPAQLRAFLTRDGKQFGVPKYHGGLALYYNKDLFDRYRVDYPDESWNYDDYLEAMRLLTGRNRRSSDAPIWGSMVDISWERIQVHVNGWGGHLVDPQAPTKCRMGEQPALEAMEWIRARMHDEDVMASFLQVNGLETRHAFIKQRLAMVEDGSWALKDILNSASFRIGAAPFPRGPARRATLATTDGWGIYAGTKHPEAAWELMKFLISKEYARQMIRAHFLQPARASLLEEWMDSIREEFPEAAREIDLAAFADGHIKGYSVTAEIFTNMAEVRPLVDVAWNRLFTLGQDSVEEIPALCRQIEALQVREG